MSIVEFIYRCEASDAPALPRPADTEAARRRLDEGNRAFAALLADSSHGGSRHVVPIDPHDFGLSPDASGAPPQRPFAAVIGCSDARVPIELVFGEGPNELFVIRVAGNGLGPEVQGSLRYAIDHLGSSLKIVTVLGHSRCGAITAAVDVALHPARYLPLATMPSLRSILDPLLIVVEASRTRLSDLFGSAVANRPGYRAALIEMSILTNAALAAHSLARHLAVEEIANVRALYGVYLLETHRIWAPRTEGRDCAGLADPPADVAQFVALGNAAARSDRITALLDRGTAGHPPPATRSGAAAERAEIDR